ncbi:Protein of unknown function [Pseudonocardia ammonioxydans]|uniref:DUF3152 domain-containing protein n=1 Tax=Pseudonocardia ammonioxydans TaxID=260086 RepID=A0A1I4ZHR1_PSUAM|nr:Protein of unknown function [Pseudonocardia ammonioxydans]
MRRLPECHPGRDRSGRTGRVGSCGDTGSATLAPVPHPTPARRPDHRCRAQPGGTGGHARPGRRPRGTAPTRGAGRVTTPTRVAGRVPAPARFAGCVTAPARFATRAAVAVLAVLALSACAPAPGGGPDPIPAPGPPAGEAGAAPARPDPTTGPMVSEADRRAGLRGRAVPASAAGDTVVVPGSTPPPAGRTRTVPMRVEVERGLAVDGPAFASFVAAVLNDARSWGGDGSVGFARTDGAAPLRVLLATPELADQLCQPLDTVGRLSCRNGDRVVLNLARWAHGTPEYAHDLTAYRRYLVNHEVGHWLGHHHETCPGPQRPAPVMQQQTLGLEGCTPNSWPR